MCAGKRLKLRNCAKIVDLEGYLEGRAECGVAADRDREIKKVQSANAGRGGIAGASKAVASAINSGIAAVEHDNAAAQFEPQDESLDDQFSGGAWISCARLRWPTRAFSSRLRLYSSTSH